MLHAYVCSRDEGVKKHRPEVLKSMKIELRGLQNPFKKQLKSDTASYEAFEPRFFRKFAIVNDFWPPKRSQNWRKNAENAMLQNNTFLHRFLLDFSSLWPPKMERKFIVFRIFIDKADFVKIIVFLKENCYFSGFEPPKIDQISM